MEWFKHATASHDDPDISDAMDEFGHSGYAVFFMTLEIYGQEFNRHNPDHWLTISQRFFSRKLRISSGKVQKILNFFSERQRIMVKYDKNDLSIKIPKFIDIASNWVKRSKPKPTEVLCSPSVGPTAIELELEEELEEEKELRKEHGAAVDCTDLVGNASSPAQDQEQPTAGFSLIPDTKKPRGRPTYPPGWKNVTTGQGEALNSISDWYLKAKNPLTDESIFPDVYKAVTRWLKNGVHPDVLIELLEYVKNDKEIGEINSYYAYFQRALMVESPNRHEAEYIKKTRKQIADAEGSPGDLLQKIMKECKIKDMS